MQLFHRKIGIVSNFSGTTYGGKWDHWYGPSGRENSLSSVENQIDSDVYIRKVEYEVEFLIQEINSRVLVFF